MAYFAIGVGLGGTLTAQVQAQEWTRFRGPNGTGLSQTATLPTTWTEADFNWKVKLPGIGHGAPVIWGNKIFLLASDPATAERRVVCLAAEDGRVLWAKSYPSAPHALHNFNSYASSTPTVDGDRVYVYWTTPDDVTLLALDHQGQEIWRRNLGIFDSMHGGATSPILHNQALIIANDHDQDGSITALDPATGRTLWSHPRRGLERGTAYGVPCIWSPKNGPEQLILSSQSHGISSLDPVSGKLNWEISESAGKPLFNVRAVSSPMVTAEGLVFGTCGSGGGGNYLVAVRPPSGPDAKPAVAYKIDKAAPYVPTPLLYNEMLFLVSDGGIASCLDPATGTLHWQERLPGAFFGSPICVNGIIYCIARNGDVSVFRAAKTYEFLGKNPLGEESHSTPAVSGGRMYLRTFGHLISVGGNTVAQSE